MISNEMKFRQVFESYVMVGVSLLSVLIFILTPSHADDEILIRLNEFWTNIYSETVIINRRLIRWLQR